MIFADFPGSWPLHRSSFLNLNHTTACRFGKKHFTLFLNNTCGLTNSLTGSDVRNVVFSSGTYKLVAKTDEEKKQTLYTHTQQKTKTSKQNSYKLC